MIQTPLHTAEDYRKPFLWHEYNNTYIAPLPDLDVEKKLTGAMTQTEVLEHHRQRIESYGLLPRYPELRQQSFKLYREYVKQAFEELRHMPRVDGFAWWVVSDIPGGVETDVTSFGVLDMVYKPEKFTDTAWFRQFNGQSVLLIDAGIDARVLRSSEAKPVRVSLSHFGAPPVKNGRLEWKLTADGKILKQGTIKDIRAAAGSVTEIASLKLGPLNLADASAVHLEATFTSASGVQSNSWKFWAFPDLKPGLPRANILNLTENPALDARYGASPTMPLGDAALVLATTPTEELLSHIDQGGKVILLESDAGRAAPLLQAVKPPGSPPLPEHSSFLLKPGAATYWASWIRCNAQLIEDHPMLAAFPHEGFTDFQLARLFGHSVPTVNYTPKDSVARGKVRPIIWNLNLSPWTEDPTPWGFALTWNSLLSEARMGKGRMVLCNLWALDGLTRGLPEAGYLLDCLVDYAFSEKPAAGDLPALTADEARRLFRIGVQNKNDPLQEPIPWSFFFEMKRTVLPVFCAATLLIHAAAAEKTMLSNGSVELKLQGTSITSLRAGSKQIDFIKNLKPEFWHETAETRVKVDGTTAVIEPLEEWRVDDYGTPSGTDTPVPIAPGQRLGQTFRIPEGVVFSEVGVKLPTWLSKTSAVTVTVSREGKSLASRRIENVDQNVWQVVAMDVPQGAGDYLVEVSDAVGQIGWWTSEKDIHGHAEAWLDGKPVAGDRAIQIKGRRLAGTGKLTVALDDRTVSISAVLTPTSDAPYEKFPWVWKTTWKKDGYDCSPEAGVVFKRIYTDTLSYMPVEQLKRRPHVAKGCLRFVWKDWIEMDGTADADLRVSGNGLSMFWDMTADEMAMRILSVPRREADGWHSGLKVEVKEPGNAMPAEFPRFDTSDPELTRDLNRLWWERGLSFSSPAQPTIVWADWMGLMWGWFAGPPRDAEMAHIAGYPMTPEGYMHTWGAEAGWPLVRDGRDTRHFETNARYILGCWRHFLFTGDLKFLRSQQDRLRKTMSYQLETLRGKEGLVVTPSFKTGRHQDLSNNYWDILPFGHLDAYANITYYASLTAMEQMEKALGTTPLTGYAKLRELAHRRYDEVFWNDEAGRYIGCVDIDGARHDYGFTFINLEALHYGLGDEAKAKRIYHWMETEATSSGKADTYTKWIFAPRTTTIHNPMWGPDAPKSETDSPVKPWWTFWWPGKPFGEQCQDGGAIFYTSFFDLMNRSRTFGAENAWKRFQEILARYRMPDRLCGGNPLYLGEISQQEDGGAVGTDYPFAESGLVPLYFLYGIIGLEPKPDALHITPRLPAALEFTEVSDVSWQGAKLRIRVTPATVDITGTTAAGTPLIRHFDIKIGEPAVLKAEELRKVNKARRASH